MGSMKIQCRAQASQDEKGWQTEDFVQAGTDPMLSCCITWIFFYLWIRQLLKVLPLPPVLF